MTRETLKLTSPRQKVFDVLRDAGRPLKPYDILRQLDQQGTPAHPPTIYRALDFLTTAGLVHRLDSAGAFVACNHGAHGATAMLLVCQTCGAVDECDGAPFLAGVQHESAKRGFKPDLRILEIRGSCQACAT
ncbi:MAG: transcriptional repressor [Hyphomonadaceae bacterium]|jgi:Fur family zinc uptake transcriptional regulator|nr:transcriptional repressor [Hyphomonadaceae bacterium]